MPRKTGVTIDTPTDPAIAAVVTALAGVLSVTRVEGGLSTILLSSSGVVKASAGKVYWITILNQNNTRKEGYIKDGGSGGTSKWRYGMGATQGIIEHVIFDPPIECDTSIYLTLGELHRGTVGYI